MNTLTPLTNYSSGVGTFNSKSNQRQLNQINFKGLSDEYGVRDYIQNTITFDNNYYKNREERREKEFDKLQLIAASLGVLAGSLGTVCITGFNNELKQEHKQNDAKEYVIQADKAKAGELLIATETGKTINWVDVADSIKAAQDSIRIYEKGRADGYKANIESAVSNSK